mgnify:CR=1 FL=1
MGYIPSKKCSNELFKILTNGWGGFLSDPCPWYKSQSEENTGIQSTRRQKKMSTRRLRILQLELLDLERCYRMREEKEEEDTVKRRGPQNKSLDQAVDFAASTIGEL